MANIAVGCDLNRMSTDKQNLQVVCDKLTAAGHTVKNLGVGPGVCQRWGQNSASKGWICVMMVNGADLQTYKDFGVGIGSYYNYSRCIFGLQGYITPSTCSCEAARTAKLKKAHDDYSASSFTKELIGMTTAQVCEKYSNTISYACGSSVSELATNILARVNGGTLGDGSGTAVKTIGYDKTKPLDCYIQIDYTTSASDEIQNIIIDFTEKSSNFVAHQGITPVCINNTVRQGMFNVVERMRSDNQDYDEELRFYVHRIRLKTSPRYKDFYDSSNDNDQSSNKMDIYGFGFHNGTLINPTDLNSCGKTISSQFDELIKSSGYLVEMEYAKHRKNDIINFKIDNQKDPVFEAHEGDDNNILKFSNISYTPVSDLFNSSIQVFKVNTETGQEYRYTETKDSSSMLEYGQMSVVKSTSELMGGKEAYYQCIHNEKFNPNSIFSYTIVVPFAQALVIGDLVKIKSDDRKINTIKKVESVKWTYKNNQIPKIQTELGLGELAPDLQLKKQLRDMRNSAKTESTLFSSTAKKIQDPAVYTWEN